MISTPDLSNAVRAEFYGTLYYADGKFRGVSNNDIVSNSVTLTESACNGDFGFGAFLASQLDITFINTSEYLLSGSRFELSYRYYDIDSILIYEHKLGVFYPDLSSVKRSKNNLKVTFYDGSVKFDTTANKTFVNFTAFGFIQQACTECGVTLATTATQAAAFPNGKSDSPKFTYRYSAGTKTTYRQLVCAALQLMGAFGRINRDGQFVVCSLNKTTADFTINADNAIKRSISDTAERITGVSGDTQKFGSGLTYDLSGNIITGEFTAPTTTEDSMPYQALAEIYYGGSGKVIGVSSYAADISWFGDLSVEPGDCYEYVQDGLFNGTRKSVVHETIWKPHGACTIRTYSTDNARSQVSATSSQSGTSGGGATSTDVSYIRNSLLGGLTIQKVTRAEYNALTPSANVIYYVTETDGSVNHYLGSAQISGGGGGGGTSDILVWKGNVATAGGGNYETLTTTFSNTDYCKTDSGNSVRFQKAGKYKIYIRFAQRGGSNGNTSVLELRVNGFTEFSCSLTYSANREINEFPTCRAIKADANDWIGIYKGSAGWWSVKDLEIYVEG